MDLATIQDTLKAWAKLHSGLPCVWDDDARPTMIKPWVILIWPAVIKELGTDYAVETDNLDDTLTATVVGDRLITVGVKVESRSKTANRSASYYLEMLRGSLTFPSVVDTFQAADMAVATLGDSYGMGVEVDSHMENVAQFDIFLNAIIAQADPTPLGTIGSIGLSSAVSSPDGTVSPVLNLDDELLQE